MKSWKITEWLTIYRVSTFQSISMDIFPLEPSRKLVTPRKKCNSPNWEIKTNIRKYLISNKIKWNTFSVNYLISQGNLDSSWWPHTFESGTIIHFSYWWYFDRYWHWLLTLGFKMSVFLSVCVCACVCVCVCYLSPPRPPDGFSSYLGWW